MQRSARAALAILAASLFVAPAEAQLRGGDVQGLRPLIDDRPLPYLVRARPGRALDAVTSLSALGASVELIEGQPLIWRDYLVVHARAAEIEAIGELPLVAERMRLPPPGILPLDRSSTETGLGFARGVGAPMDERTGRGVTIADLDSHVDVFHPDFFHADAGWFDWIDVDGDGVFTPGVDAVDLDENGEAGADEIGRVLRATLVDFEENPTSGLTLPGFDPSVDWIYLDTNGNGARNFGARDGFDDSSPALGEPLFVPDDVNGDGTLGPEERVVRLGSSKFRAVYTHVDSPRHPAVDRIYRRDVDLSQSPADITGGVNDDTSDTFHATPVLAILAGGVPLPSRRFVGFAPDADLINAFGVTDNDARRVMWALTEEPDIMLHEYVSWTRVPLDGSDPVSRLIDSSSDLGVLHVCPAGNIGDAGRHGQREVRAGTSETLAFTAPAGEEFIDLSVHVRGDRGATVEIIEPDGTPLLLSRGGAEVPATTGGTLFTFGLETIRETVVHHVTLYMTRSGSWGVRVTAPTSDATVHGYLADSAGFARSSTWDDESPASTLAMPATADRCIAVGAVPSHAATEGVWYERSGAEMAGEVRAYSARGPRIDGDIRPHLVAPDNPWAPVGHGELYPSFPGTFYLEPASYRVFGGTSGAGPHVAGAAALLIESGSSAEEVAGRLQDTAITTSTTGAVPNSDYGFGQVHVGAALGASTGPAEPPMLTLRAEPSHARPLDPVRLIVEAAPGVEIRWDDDYDGDWETEYAAPSERTETFGVVGFRRFKVRARGADGLISEAAVLVEISTSAPDPDAGCGCHAPGRSRRGAPALAILIVLATLARPRRRR